MKHTQQKSRQQFLLAAFGAAAFSFLGALSYVNGTGFPALEGRITPTQSVSRTAAPASGTVKPAAQGPVVTKLTLEKQKDDYDLSPWSFNTATVIGYYSDGVIKNVPANWFYKLASTELVAIPGCTKVESCKIPLLGDVTNIKVMYADVFVEDKTYVYSRVRMKLPVAVPTFKDEIPSWAKDSISQAARLGIMGGYEDGSFGAADTLTNAQFAVMLHRSLKVLALAKDTECIEGLRSPFSTDHFAYNAFCYFGNNALDISWAVAPNEPITRLNTATMLGNIVGEETIFALLREYSIELDIDAIMPGLDLPIAQERAVFFVHFARIMNSDNLDENLNRAEAATVIMRTLNYLHLREF